MVEGAFVHKIQIQLSGADASLTDRLQVGGDIASLGEAMRDGTDTIRETIVIVPMRPHVVSIGRRRIHSGHEGRATRSADRRSREDTSIALTSLREAIEIWGLGNIQAVDSNIGTKLIPNNPNDVWEICGTNARNEKKGTSAEKPDKEVTLLQQKWDSEKKKQPLHCPEAIGFTSDQRWKSQQKRVNRDTRINSEVLFQGRSLEPSLRSESRSFIPGS